MLIKRILFQCLTCFFSISAFSQIVFEDQFIIDNSAVPLEANSVYATDIDGDGDMDVLSASHLDNKIAWYENLDGLGHFSIQQIITTDANYVRSVHAADLDGDGDMDVLSASGFDDKIAWYENIDGLGNFSTQQIITTDANGAGSVYATDVDGDGDMDVLSASSGDDKIIWYENTDGLGDFSTPQVVSTNAAGASSVYATDIDGDGDVDILSSSLLDNKIAWYENTDGLGGFSAQQIISTAASGAEAVYAADVDGDGDMDVLSASTFDDKIAWYENIDGLGGFTTQQIITTDANSVASVYAADVDGDGDMDVLFASTFDNKIAWHENTDGLGSFSAEQIISTFANGARSVYAADIDGDGNLDVLSASLWDHRIAWYGNTDGLGNFGDQQIISNNISVSGLRSLHVADLDGDGDMDVLSASSHDDKIAWYENLDGLGSFGVQQVITTYADGAMSVYAADLDSDGDMDVLSAARLDNKIAWYENMNGLGDFGNEQIISTEVELPFFVYAADLDGDGDMDVLADDTDDDQIVWYENTDGLGNFDPQQIISIDGNNYSFYVSDIDGDEDLDIFMVEDGNITWYKNTDGLGSFSLQEDITTDVEHISLFAQDLDGDGDMDLVSAASDPFNDDGNDKLIWYENLDGLGDFGSPQIIANDISDSPVPVYVSDVDGDGDMDIIYSSWFGNEVIWYENTDGLGDFGTEPNILSEIGRASSIFAVDIDSDGDNDLLSALIWDDNIVLHKNLGLDTQPPIAKCQDRNVELDDSGYAMIEESSLDNGSTDDIAIMAYQLNENTFTCTDLGPVEVILTVVDGAGNLDSCTAIINVVDTLSPIVNTQNIIIDLAGEASISIVPEQINDLSTDNCGIANMSLDQNTFTAIGEYQINLVVEDISSNSASGSAIVTVINSTVGLEEINLFNENLNVYPIPTSGLLSIDSDIVIEQIEIYNRLGQLVLSNRHETKIDVSHLNQGLYFCKIKGSGGNFGIRKIVKE